MKRAQRIFDKTIGRLVFTLFRWLCRLGRKSRYFGQDIDLRENGFKKILVIRPGGIGDALVARPFFLQLRDHFPAGSVDVLCSKRNVSVIGWLIDARKILLVDDFKRIFSLFKELMGNGYDVVFDLDQGTYISSVLTFLTGAPVRIGFDIRRRRDLYTHAIQYREDRRERENFLRQLLPFGLSADSSPEQMLLPIPPEALRRARQLLRESGVSQRDLVIMFNIGGLNRQNRLATDKWGELAEKILEWKRDARIIFTGDRHDAAQVRQLVSQLDSDRLIDFCGRTTLLESIALMNLSDLFVGHDGGPLHMAVASGCRTVSIWGPSLFEKWAPEGLDHGFVRKELFCQPCVYGRFPEFPGCPYQLRCMRTISAGDIFREVKRLIDEASSHRVRRDSEAG